MVDLSGHSSAVQVHLDSGSFGFLKLCWSAATKALTLVFTRRANYGLKALPADSRATGQSWTFGPKHWAIELLAILDENKTYQNYSKLNLIEPLYGRARSAKTGMKQACLATEISQWL